MKSNKYWEFRQAQDMFRYMDKAENTADLIAKVYLRTSRYLSLTADDIYEKYQTKHRLSGPEAARLINLLQDRTSLDEMLQKLRSTADSNRKKELLAKLEAPAYQARLDRLRQIQSQLDAMMRTVYEQEKSISTNFYTDLASEAYYRNMYNMQQRAGIASSFSYINQKKIDRVLKSKWSGSNYSQLIWKNTRELAQGVKEELLISLITGRSNKETAEIIEKKFGSGAAAARRLVRTESNFLATEMNFLAYEDVGIKKYRFLATLDLKTSKICRSLDGMVFLIRDRKTGLNCPPMHPWCRSTIIAVTNILERMISKLTRSAIDPATGKRIKVPMDMTFNQWYVKFVKNKELKGGETNGGSKSGRS